MGANNKISLFNLILVCVVFFSYESFKSNQVKVTFPNKKQTFLFVLPYLFAISDGHNSQSYDNNSDENDGSNQLFEG